MMLMCAVGVSHASDTRSQMTLGSVVTATVMKNPELKSVAYRFDLSRENIARAQASLLPTVSVSGDVAHVQSHNNDDGEWRGNTPKSVGVSVQQLLYDGQKSTLNRDEQNIRWDIAHYEVLSFFQSKIVDAVTVYMETYKAQEARDVRLNNVQLLEKQLTATTAQFEAGDKTKTDVMQAQARLAEAKAQYEASQADYESAKSRLWQESGVEGEYYATYPDFSFDKLPQTLEEAIALALENHPDLEASRLAIEAQQLDVLEKQAAFYPEISLNASADLDFDPLSSQYDRQSAGSVGVNVNLPLYQGGERVSEMRRSKILKSQALDDLEAVRRQVTHNVVSAWEIYQAVKVQIDAREKQVSASQQSYQGVQLEEEVGARSVLDVLDANQEVLDAQLALIEAKSDFVSSYYTLLRSINKIDASLWDKFQTRL